MKIDHILEGARLNLPTIARFAKVKLGYLKQLSAGNSDAGPDTREKIAAYFERHAAALLDYARQLRNPTE